MRRPGAQRSTSAAGQASAPTISVRRWRAAASPPAPSPAAGAGRVARAAGGISACVMPCSSRTAASSSPSQGPSGGTTRVAPESTEMKSSSTEASKLGEENCSTRSPGRTA